jgi:hypothetical protein
MIFFGYKSTTIYNKQKKLNNKHDKSNKKKWKERTGNVRQNFR